MLNSVNAPHRVDGQRDFVAIAEIIVWSADDDAEVRKVMGQVLNQSRGVRLVRDFASAEALLQALEVAPAPHVILLDLRMKGMNGLEAIRPIKARAPQTHVIVFTSFFDHASRQKALAAGASDFLLKRLAADKIVDAIKNLFRMEMPQPAPGVIQALRPPGPVN